MFRKREGDRYCFHRGDYLLTPCHLNVVCFWTCGIGRFVRLGVDWIHTELSSRNSLIFITQSSLNTSVSVHSLMYNYLHVKVEFSCWIISSFLVSYQSLIHLHNDNRCISLYCAFFRYYKYFNWLRSSVKLIIVFCSFVLYTIVFEKIVFLIRCGNNLVLNLSLLNFAFALVFGTCCLVID